MAVAQSTTAARSLEEGLRRVHREQAAAAARYDRTREEVRAALRARDIGEERIANLLEAFERHPLPTFEGALPRAGAQDAYAQYAAGAAAGFSGALARRTYDEALRAHLGPRIFADFVGALRDHRAATATLTHLQDVAYAAGGAKAVSRAAGEADRLEDLRRDVLEIARRMNPAVTVETLASLTGDGSDYDPLRHLARVALDPARLDVRQEVHRQLWLSVADLLGPRERAVVDEWVAGRSPESDPRDRLAAAAEAFAAWASPAGRRKPEPGLARAFGPARRFLERCGNAARGRGFQRAEDVFARARDGRVASRRARDGEGIRAPAAAADRGGHDRMAAAIGRLSDLELVEAVEIQDRAVLEARKRHSSLARRALDFLRPGVGILDREGGTRAARGREDLDGLMRGRRMLLAERRRRAEAGLDQAAAAAGLAPDRPPSGPSPSGPEGPGSGYRGAAAAAFRDNLVPFPGKAAERQELHPGQDAGLPGRHGFYTIASAGTDGWDLALRAGNRQAPLGRFRDRETAATFAAAVDAAPEKGGASSRAAALAERASAAGTAENRDIRTIRDSGLLDPVLDAAIAARSMQAYVYPLVSGDLVWQEGETGRWRAGTLQEFAAHAAGRGDADLSAAAEVIAPRMAAAGERTADGRTWLSVSPADEARAAAAGARWDPSADRYYAPTAQVAERTGEWQRGAVPEPRPAPAGAAAFTTLDGRPLGGKERSASFSGGRPGSGEEPGRALTGEEVRAAYRAATERLGVLGREIEESGLSPDRARERIELRRDMAALEGLAGQRGIDLRPADTARQAAARNAAAARRTRETGQGR
jgi:hypothetical protein